LSDETKPSDAPTATGTVSSDFPVYKKPAMYGQTLLHYRVVKKLGEGGMGEVYLARDERLDRDVAIKVLPIPRDVLEETQRLGRFQREARLLASLNHPNIATLYGVERHEDRHFFVMELVQGETLSARLENGPIAIEDAFEFARQIAVGLGAAHDEGIIHRDLKPSHRRPHHRAADHPGAGAEGAEGEAGRGVGLADPQRRPRAPA
jgi:serine/threonine-protein kinase